MTGGFSGVAKVVGEDVMNEAKDEMQFALRDQLARDIEAQIPADFTTFENGLMYSFEELPQTDESDESVRVNLRGVVHAVIFNKSALGKAVASKFMDGYAGGDVEVSNLGELGFSVVNSDVFNPETDSSFELAMNGNALFVWIYNEEALKKDLAGVAKRDVDNILSRYPAIESADVIVKPFWNRTLPKEVEKIRVTNIASAE
jgi:hypothetical protein